MKLPHIRALLPSKPQICASLLVFAVHYGLHQVIALPGAYFPLLWWYHLGVVAVSACAFWQLRSWVFGKWREHHVTNFKVAALITPLAVAVLSWCFWMGVGLMFFVTHYLHVFTINLYSVVFQVSQAFVWFALITPAFGVLMLLSVNQQWAAVRYQKEQMEKRYQHKSSWRN